jgi:hypothetical protein
VLFPGGRQTPMRVNLRLTTRGALSRHRCRGVRLRKQARLYYKCPPTAPAAGAIGSTFRSLVESLHQVTFLYPGLHFIPRTSQHASTVSRSRSRALLGTVGQYFIVPFGTRGCRPKGSLYRRNPQSGRGRSNSAKEIADLRADGTPNVAVSSAVGRPSRHILADCREIGEGFGSR